MNPWQKRKHLDWPAGENILDNILFGSFISVDLKQTDYEKQVD